MTAHNLSSSKYYVKSKFDMNRAKCYIIMCLKNVFGRVRVSEANEHPNVNIKFFSSNESCQMLHHHVFKKSFRESASERSERAPQCQHSFFFI